METVRWKVIGWREVTHVVAAGTPDAHVVPGATCDRCSAAIRYVVTVKSTVGEVLQVGQDCAVTLEGGPELAEIRSAERAYEREQYLASPEYKAEQARIRSEKDAKAARAAKLVVSEVLTLEGLKAIVESGNTSDFEKNRSKAAEHKIRSGAYDAGVDQWDPEFRGTLAIAVRKAYLGASRTVGQVGEKIVFSGVLEALIPVDTQYGTSYVQKFRDDTGAVFVWFSAAAGKLGRKDLGRCVTLKGTIKAHKDYQGEVQTVVTRCKELSL
jgi:hypothetical protein